MPILLKVHLATILFSFIGFVLRGIWRLQGSMLLETRFARVLPHVNDSVLFFSGLGMVVLTHQYPWQQPWLATKLLALLLYIFLGAKALRAGGSRATRAVYWVLALLVFAYIVLVARYHHPLPLVVAWT